MLSIDEQLRNKYLVTPHSVPNLVLVFHAHEDVPLFILHQQVSEDLLDKETSLVRAAYYAHGCGVQNYFASVFFFITLSKDKPLLKQCTLYQIPF